MKTKRNLYAVVVAVVIVVFFGFILACTSSGPEEVEKPTVEYQLAVINEGGHVEEDDPVVAEFKDLVESIDEKSVEGQTDIGDILVKAQEILWDNYKIRVSLLGLTRELEKSLPDDGKDLNFEEIAVMYITVLGESQ
jgi:hypothetical protein